MRPEIYEAQSMRLALSWLPFLVAGFTIFAEATENNHNDNYLADQTKQFDEKKDNLFLFLSCLPSTKKPEFYSVEVNCSLEFFTN